MTDIEKAIKLIQGIKEDGWNVTAEDVEALALAIKALEEKLQGEWVPIKYRPMTAEERIEFAEYYGVEFCDMSNEKVFDCPMPEDGQEILISTSWGVVEDVADNDIAGEGFTCYGLESNGDWDGIDAWMPKPKPYKSPLDHSDEPIRCKAENCSPEGCKHCAEYKPIDFGGAK